MKSKIGFYFDAQKLGNWDWDSFLSGDIGMSGTDGQLLLLVNDLSNTYEVYFFTNVDGKTYKNFETVKVNNLADAAVSAKKLGIELIICNNRGDSNTIEGIKKLDELKQPFILWDQNGPTANLEGLLSNSKFLKRIVNVSKTQANWHRHRKYFSKICYIYNGKDYPAVEIGNPDMVSVNMGYLGAVSESKGFHWVAQAWPKVRAKFPDATLTVIGSIKTHDRTRETGDLGISEPHLEDKFIKPYLGSSFEEIKNNGIIFTGHITPNEMPRYLQTLQLGIVNPNIKGGSNETFCVSAIDFAAYGVPVIGANTGGLKETIGNGLTGVLINQSEKLADAIIDVFSNREKLNYFRSNCPGWVKENFSRARVIADWEKVINDVLGNKKNKPVGFDFSDLSAKSVAKEILRVKNRFVK